MKAMLSNQSVLVVDDESFILETTGFMLTKLGFEHVYKAEGVEQALVLLDAAESPINLVISDLNMPERDGVELLRELAERSYDGDIVLFSGEDERTLKMAESLAKARDLSVLGAIAKPMDVSELTALLAKRGKVVRKGGQKKVELVSPESLAAAIEAGELQAWFQPKVEIATKQVVAVEALVRWPCPVLGMIFPDAFIPVAEEHGMIDALTKLMIEKSVAAGRQWLDKGVSLKIAVNVSMDSLYDLSFPEQVASIQAAGGVESAPLQLEVTESRLMEDLVRPLDVLLRLRLKKITLSIDDFGTGHSNLTQVRDLPFDEIKLDRSFIQGAAESDKSRQILESSVEIAKRLGLRIVAEGVETLDDWKLVEELGCDEVQGYFVSRPIPGDEIPEWVANWPELKKTLFTD